jgi:hypothetical protein
VSLLAGPSAGAMTTTTSTAGASPSATTTNTCDRAPWELRVQGRPHHLDGGDRGGVYVWHDTNGFHLRVTHRTTERVVFSGVVTSSAPMRMEPVKLEYGDVAHLSPDHRDIAFAFSNHGHIDGIDFHTDCARTLTVSHLYADVRRLSANRVYLGATKVNPAHVPFVVHRLV